MIEHSTLTSRSSKKFDVATTIMVGLILFQTSPLMAQTPDYGRPAQEPGPLYHHASTIDQGYLDGWAAVNRSIGQARYNSALAARHYQAAYEHALDNALRKVDFYYGRKTMRRQYEEKHRRPQLTLKRILQHNKMRTPDRLTPQQFSESTRRLYWPPALSGDIFTTERDRLDQLFADRTPTNSGRGSSNLRQIAQSVERLTELLGQRVRSGEIDAQEFCAANRFLRSVRYEAHFTSRDFGLAAK